MDKNKNRTDLLAAGRKKLQQYRQKKDTKGSKSAGKAGKSERDSDADAASTAAKPAVVLLQDPDGEVSSLHDSDSGIVDSSITRPSENSQAIDNIDIATNDPLSVVVIPETGTDTTTLASCVELPHEDSGVYESTMKLSVGKEQDFDPLVPYKVESTHTVNAEGARLTSTGNLESVVSEMNSVHLATPMPVDSSTQPDLVGTTKPVAIAVEAECIHGADQGADCLDSEQVNRSSGIELEGDVRPDLPGFSESAETCAGTVSGEPSPEPTIEVDQTDELNDASASAGATNEVKEVWTMDGHSVSAQPFSDLHVSSTVNPEVAVHQREDAVATSLNEEKSEMQFHQQLLDEMSIASTLVGEVQGRNESLAEDLAKCKSELQAAVCAKEELEKQVHTAKAEVVEISSRADELHVELERSHGELSSLSAELAECKPLVAALQVENDKLNGSLTLAVEEKKKLAEEKGYLVLENDKLLTELADFKFSLSSLQSENVNLSGTLALTTEERRKLEVVKENFLHENQKLLNDLAECKALLETLEVDNAQLNGSLTSVTEERNKLGEEKDHFVTENEKLSVELADCKSLMAGLQVEHLKALDDLKEATLHLEKLTEENIKLSSRSGEAANQVEGSDMPSRGPEYATAADETHWLPREGEAELFSPRLRKSDDDLVDGSQVEQLKLDVYDHSCGFVDLKGHLEEAEKIVQKLEKAIEGMHSHSVSLSKSSGKTAPGISKLIQAFESKTHHDDHDIEEVPSAENQSLVDTFMLAKEQTRNLRAVLKELLLDAVNASELFKGERDCRYLADDALGELKVAYEALKEHNISSEAANIEVIILYEFIKQHVCDIEAKKGELLGLYEAVRQHSTILGAENSELVKKIGDYQPRISVLERQLDEMHSSSDEMASSISNQVEVLHKEVAERASILEQEWNSTVAQVVQTVEKLDALIRSLFSSTPSIGNHDCLDIGSRVAASVDAATKVIDNLQEKLEASGKDHKAMCSLYKDMIEKFNDLHRKNELAIGVLHGVHGNLERLVNDSCEHVEQSQIIKQNENLIDPLHLDNYDTLMEQLADLLGERLQFKSMNDKLNLELIDMAKEMEELKKRGLDSDTILKLVEDVEGAVKLDGTVIDSDKLESRLQRLISFLFQKYKEADEPVSLSSKEMELSELQGQVEHLSFLIVQHDNETLILKESLRQGVEDLVAVRAELQEKVNELEQSDQRVSSIREKLSIAVSKGKGLIVQRDNLKQSLAETSSELEKCSQELQLKDARLWEVETKLKTYSEAGERVEALESELSYIRNSATALRESFLLKDSILQRIEEILEDLELPEHFHARDIIEKVDWLARSVTGNSVPPADWDQKSSVGGGSYSDAGFVAMETWKEDTQPNSNSGDDLRGIYEELQSKFYGLAEQNEMLEQSLMERNNVVQRWEETLERINMPLQLRSMEPEDRIEWLGSALSEAHHHCNSLQQKVNNLETYCSSLTADVEESQKRLYDLETALQAVLHEKEHLSDSLGILTRDYDKVSEKVVRFELENDKLENEISALQEKLVEKEHLSDSLEILTRDYDKVSEKAVQFELKNDKLQKEVSALQEKLVEKEHLSDSLEILTRDFDKVSEKVVQFELENDKLQEEVSVLQEKLVEKVSNQEHIEGEIRRLEDLVHDLLKDSVTEDVVSSGSSTECLEQLLKKLLEKYTTLALENPILVDSADEKNTKNAGAIQDEKRDSEDSKEDVAVLKKELEEALQDLLCVKEERDRYMESNQSLVHEVEALDVKRKELQELLSQEEQKSISVREKLNVAVRKGKSLVQQRDSLKQTIEEVNNEVERLKSEVNYRESRLSDYEQNIKDLSTYQERLEVQESESLFMRNRLAETEYFLQEKTNTLSLILNTLNDIGAGFEFNISDPVEKLEQIGKQCRDLHAAVASSEHDSMKSRRAAELLLAELNEVQERNDGLQDELAIAASELSELSKERDLAEAAKREAFSQVEKLSAVRSVERNNQLAELKLLKSCVDQLRKGFVDINDLLGDVLSKDLEYLHNLEASMISCLEPSEAMNVVGLPLGGPVSIISGNAENKGKFLATNSLLESKMQECTDDNIFVDICSLLGHQLQDFMKEIGALKEELYKHLITLDEGAKYASEVAGIIHREVTSQKQSFESMRENIIRLEVMEKEKDTESVVMRRNISLLYEACSSSVVEIENCKAQFVGNGLAATDLGMNSESSISSDEGNLFSRQTHLSSDERIRIMADRLLSVVKDFTCIQAQVVEGGQKEMKTTISNLQKELQEKDIQKDRICVELVSQIKKAEAAARSHLQDFQSAKARLNDLERQLEVMEEEHDMLEHRVKELEDGEATLKDSEERVRSLSDALAAKEQEIEVLMQALDEEETQMGDLRNKIGELERVVQEKNVDLENLEASRGKAMKKLSITVSKFDELHQLSASLLSEVEKLQSQLQERDAEISFLRQEVTRCTNDALVASQMNNKRNSDEILDLLTWLDTMISGVLVNDVHFDDKKRDKVHEYREIFQKQIVSLVSEMEDLRAVVQSKDTLLQVEKSRVEELTRKEESLENSLREKESQLTRLQGVGDSGHTGSTASEILEVEPLVNKWAVPGTSMTPQVRSLRKVNNDQVSIAIDTDHDNGGRLEEEDDDKAHGFKSLTTSRIVPRFTRPVTDMIDGLWVSCDRALMRQPALRLGVIIYWALIHALLATFVV
ncbi:hypothetical protein ACSBR1_037244 [Camellia fascicularis]